MEQFGTVISLIETRHEKDKEGERERERKRKNNIFVGGDRPISRVTPKRPKGAGEEG